MLGASVLTHFDCWSNYKSYFLQRTVALRGRDTVHVKIIAIHSLCLFRSLAAGWGGGGGSSALLLGNTSA